MAGGVKKSLRQVCRIFRELTWGLLDASIFRATSPINIRITLIFLGFNWYREPPIKIALNSRRNRNGPRRQSKLRWIVVETIIVLATDRNGDESSSKPQLSSPPIEIAIYLAMTSIGVLVAVNERPVVSKKHFVRFCRILDLRPCFRLTLTRAQTFWQKLNVCKEAQNKTNCNKL